MKTAHIITDMQRGYIVKFYIDKQISSVAEFSHWALAFKFAWKWKNS